MPVTTLITTDYFYKQFSHVQKEELQKHLALMKQLENTKKYLVEQFSDYKIIINSNLDLTFDELINKREFITGKSNHKNILKHLDDLFFPLTSNRKQINIEEMTKLLRSIIAVNKLIGRSEIAAERIKARVVPANVFKFALRSFNQKLGDALVEKGYEFSFGSGVGSIRVKGVEIDHSKRKEINWGESNKRKKEILARGGVPKKAERDENLKIIGDNGGEEWLVFFTRDINYWLYWNKAYAQVDNLTYYSFSPSIFLKARLNKCKELPQHVANYTIG